MKHILLFLIANIAVLVVLGGVLRLLDARGAGLDYRPEERIVALRVGAWRLPGPATGQRVRGRVQWRA